MKKLLLTLLLALAVGTGAAWAETVTYKLVTDAADIKAGAEYIIVYDTGKLNQGRWIWALGAQSGYARKAVDVTITDNTITIDPTTVSTVTLRESTNNDYPYLLGVVDDTDEAYLYNASTSNRITTTNDATTANAACSISLEGSTSTIKYPNGYYLQCYYTGGSKVAVSGQQFSCYKDTQKNPMLFKREGQETPDPKPLEKVTLEGADENGNISVEQGTILKFNAPNAATCKFVVGETTDVKEVKNGKVEYTINFPSEITELTVTATPYDKDGNTLEGTASTFIITKIVAPDCGELAFTPASGTAIFAGTTITLSADNAVIYRYGINTEAESEFSEGASFTVSENDFIDGTCTVRAYPVNSDGKRGATVVAKYTLKEADRYALVNNLAHITPNATYILLGCKTDLSECALMGKQNGTKFYEAILLNKTLEEIISIAPNDNTFNDLSKFNILKNKENYNILLSNGKYLVRNSSDISSSETVTSNADFVITFDAITGEVVISQPNKATNTIQYNSSSPRFKTYTSAQSPVYLYRLIDEEYDTEVPEELYIHGHFYDRYYDLDKPVAMEKTGDKTFTSSDIMLGGNADHTEDALSFVLTTHIPTESVARSHESADWARLTEGKVYHSGGKVAAADVKTGEEITPYTVDKHDYYTISADFSGYAPVITATRQNGITTGVENVDTDATDAPVEYFNLQGVRVDNPGAGIFIRRQGKTVTKVVVK